MKGRTLGVIVMVCVVGRCTAQLTLGNGDHVLEIGGALSVYYNQRFLDAGVEDRKKDRFRLRDAQIQLEGRYRNTFEYEVQFDLADIAQTGTGRPDPENVGLMDAYVTYKGLSHFDVTVGYTKLPYGRSSQVPFLYSPYWQRAEVVRGDIFSRRDVGITLGGTFWRQCIRLDAGVYTGLGELSLRGDNDASGQPEYVGRAEIAFPSRYRKRDIDDRSTPVPMVVVGANGRYYNKTQPTGELLPAFASGEYGLKVIDGERTAMGSDVSVQYRGFSAQVEAHRMVLRPAKPTSPLFSGRPAEQHEGYVLCGGYYAQLNHFSRRWRTILSVRYEELNLNDLTTGSQQRIGGAVAYQFRGFSGMVKAQYWHILDKGTPLDDLDWNDQIRIGLQYMFH